MRLSPRGLPTATLAEQYCRDAEASPRGQQELRQLARRAATDPTLHTTVRSPFLLRPMFLSAADRDGLERDLAALQTLLLSLPERLFGASAAAMCTALGFSPAQTMAVEDTWEDAEVLLSRADLIRTEDGFRLIEFNVHSSLGGLDSGPWHRAFLDLPTFGEFAAEHHLTFLDPIDGVAGILHAAARRRALSGTPTVGIVDWPTSYPHVRPRLDRLSSMLTRRGLDAFHCHAGELSLRHGRLCARGRQIDILYRIFVVEDVVHDPRLLTPILAAHRAGHLVLSMSFLAELVGNKGCLAMLHDPAHAASFTQPERDMVARLVPYTRWAHQWPQNGHTPGKGRPGHALAPDELVLKPAGGYSARGIVPGWSTDPATWRAAVTAAHRQPYVIQERARGIPEDVPVLEDAAVRRQQMDVNWGVFLAANRFNGAMIRAVPTATGELITTSTGASIGACFVQRS